MPLHKLYKSNHSITEFNLNLQRENTDQDLLTNTFTNGNSNSNSKVKNGLTTNLKKRMDTNYDTINCSVSSQIEISRRMHSSD